MIKNNQDNSIAIYPSILRAFSFVILGFILLVAGLSFISNNQHLIYIIILLIIGLTVSIYGILNITFRNKPVILFDKYGFLYSKYSMAKLFIPKEMIEAISLRNSPNKRLIITLKPIKQDYKQYIKNIHLPPHLITCPQETSKIKENNIIISIENLNNDSVSLVKLLQKYLNIT